MKMIRVHGNENNRLQNIGYPFGNDFTSLSFNFRNGDGIGNKKLLHYLCLRVVCLNHARSNETTLLIATHIRLVIS